MHSLIVLVMHDVSQLSTVLAGWRNAGAPAVTILDSVGTREMEEHARKDDLPLLPTIRDLLQGDEAPRKTLFAVVDNDAVEPIINTSEEILGDLAEPRKGILFVLPLAKVVGYRGP